MSQAVLAWTSDGDSAYLGARACKLAGLSDPAHTLAHAAIERYLKGLLQGADRRFTVQVLRKEFGHDLSKLLDAAIPFHPRLDESRLRKRCEALRVEFVAARYLRTADVNLVGESEHVDQLIALSQLGVLDELIRVIRNEVVMYLSKGEQQQTMLSTVRRGRQRRWRELLEVDNLSLVRFVGIE